MYEIKFHRSIACKGQTFYLIGEISRLIVVNCLLMLLDILSDQLKHVVLGPHCLVVVEQFWKYPEFREQVFRKQSKQIMLQM